MCSRSNGAAPEIIERAPHSRFFQNASHVATATQPPAGRPPGTSRAGKTGQAAGSGLCGCAPAGASRPTTQTTHEIRCEFDRLSQRCLLRDASPDLKKVMLGFGGNVVEQRHQGLRSASHAALRFSISARDSSAEKNSPRSNLPKARSNLFGDLILVDKEPRILGAQHFKRPLDDFLGVLVGSGLNRLRDYFLVFGSQRDGDNASSFHCRPRTTLRI